MGSLPWGHLAAIKGIQRSLAARGPLYDRPQAAQRGLCQSPSRDAGEQRCVEPLPVPLGGHCYNPRPCHMACFQLYIS